MTEDIISGGNRKSEGVIFGQRPEYDKEVRFVHI